MKRIIQKELCYGCGSCAQKCTSGAIIMTKDAQGFLYPIINEKKCTNCGLCIKSCPAINRKTQKKEPINEAYAVKSIYSQDCASGGAFYNIAKEWINNGGYVAGSIWNEEFIPEIILTNDINKLKKMQGSKYVQGTTNNSYEQTLKLLNQNIKVLYSGTPCQIAGLYSFLNKDYTNLYTIEILCHAGGSPKFWQKYVEFVNKKYNKTLIDCKIQKSKDKMILSFNDNTTVIENLNLGNEYISFFLTGKTKRDACNTCPFMGRIRNADIIIGDIWAKWAAKKRKDGISLVILNSNKAQKLFENIKWEYINNFDINSKLNEPLNKINNNLPIPDPDRKAIFNKISSDLSFSEIIKNKKIALMNYNYPRDNYGALLLAFALEKVLKNMGYEPYTINYYKNPFCIDFDPQGATWKFREKFLHLYGFYNDNERLHLLNDNFETFIFGSDIIWAQTREYVYYGDWVNSSKRIISYAASFCENKLPPKDEYKQKCKCGN